MQCFFQVMEVQLLHHVAPTIFLIFPINKDFDIFMFDSQDSVVFVSQGPSSYILSLEVSQREPRSRSRRNEVKLEYS